MGLFVSRFKMCIGLLAAILFSVTTAHARGTPDGFADLVEKLTPAVVNISTAKNVGGLAGTSTGGLKKQAVSLGSGFIIDSSGIVITNDHVIAKADEITVTLHDGREFIATLRGTDQETDIAVLQLQTRERLPSVKFGDSTKSRVGDWVVAIGNPFGLGGSVSAGIISGSNRNIDSGLYDDFIQTDAAINRGNSGGPLFDMNGNVVGVNTAIFSQTGGSVGVGFALSSDLAKTVVRQLIQFGETQRGWLGVTLLDVEKESVAKYNVPSTSGAYIESVRTNSPAARAGLQKGDFIVKFNGRRVSEVRDLTRAVADTKVGATVTAELYRARKLLSVRVTVTRREIEQQLSQNTNPSVLPSGASATGGMVLQQMTSELKEQYNLAHSTQQGVVITSIEQNSEFSRVLNVGDVILELGWEAAISPQAVVEKMDKLRAINSGPIQVYIQRGDLLFYEQITP